MKIKTKQLVEKKERTEKAYESQKLQGKAEVKTEKTIQKEKEKVRVYHPPIPFPQILKQTKLNDQFAKFLNMFRKLEINIPFAEALDLMPHYVKFLKEIISKKRKLDECGIVRLSANYSAII